MPSITVDTQEVVRNLAKFEQNVKSAAKLALRLTGAQVVVYANIASRCLHVKPEGR